MIRWNIYKKVLARFEYTTSRLYFSNVVIIPLRSFCATDGVTATLLRSYGVSATPIQTDSISATPMKTTGVSATPVQSFLWWFNLTRICEYSLSESWFLDANVGLEIKMSVWTPYLIILDLLPEFANELDGYWFIWFFCEGGSISPGELSPLEANTGMLLLTLVDAEVFFFWRLCLCITIAKGY